MALLLTQDDMKPFVTDPRAMDDAFRAIEQAYREYAESKTRHIETLGVPLTSDHRSLRICPGYAAGSASIRTYPVVGRNVPDASVNLLFDGTNGQLLAMMAGDDVNMFRTAAPAGLAARYLAPPGARTLAMLGSGRQARPQLIALLRAAPSIERARVYSPNADHRRQYAAEMSARAGIPVEAVDDPRRAVEGADVIGICSNSRQPVLEASWVRPGAFIVSISGGQLPNDLITSSRVTVCTREDVVGPDAKREPYTSMIASGEWAADRVAAEMSEIILGKIPGRVSDDETVVHEMPGVSFWDTAIVNLAYRWAVTHEVGTPFNLSSPA